MVSSPQEDKQEQMRFSESKGLDKNIIFCFDAVVSTISNTDRSNSPLNDLMGLEGNSYTSKDSKDD